VEEEKISPPCRCRPRVHLPGPARRGGKKGNTLAGNGLDRFPIGAPVDDDHLDGLAVGDLKEMIDERIELTGFTQDGNDDGDGRCHRLAHPGPMNRLRISSIRLRFTLKS
jgi:hypothetical protein